MDDEETINKIKMSNSSPAINSNTLINGLLVRSKIARLKSSFVIHSIDTDIFYVRIQYTCFQRYYY